MGSLNAQHDFGLYYQNYSYIPQQGLVKEDEEATFHYTFQLHPQLEPDSYYLAHTVFYESSTAAGRRIYSSTFFNSTVELHLPTSSEYDIKEIFKALTYLSYGIVLIFMTVMACSPELANRYTRSYFSGSYLDKSKKYD
jgi:hypothetical protein